MINIVIPMAGAGSRFSQAGYSKPKPFIDVAGKPMIVRVLENLGYPEARYILIARKEHMDAEPALEASEVKTSAWALRATAKTAPRHARRKNRMEVIECSCSGW